MSGERGSGRRPRILLKTDWDGGCVRLFLIIHAFIDTLAPVPTPARTPASTPSFDDTIPASGYKQRVIAFNDGQVADAVVVTVACAGQDERPPRTLHQISVDRIGGEAATHVFAQYVHTPLERLAVVDWRLGQRPPAQRLRYRPAHDVTLFRPSSLPQPYAAVGASSHNRPRAGRQKSPKDGLRWRGQKVFLRGQAKTRIPHCAPALAHPRTI